MDKASAYRSNPVYIIGAGGIVNSAHLPAYAIAGFNVEAICDLDHTKAEFAAQKFNIPRVFSSAEEMILQLPANAVIDIAVPGNAIIPLLEILPGESFVLMQKPMGEDLAAAKQILALTREKKMTAAVNFQLRYAPFITEARRMIADDLLGVLNDIEINVNVFTPWHLWDFLYTAPRVEILYHSIHYIDLIRCLAGEPNAIYAKTTQHPLMKDLASVKTSIIMDYGSMLRGSILTNHCHVYGEAKQQSYIKIEGSKGAIKIQFGALQNYPQGVPDVFEYVLMENGRYGAWQTKAIAGSWFPHAFIGSMEQVLMAASGQIQQPGNSVEDSIHTMACVEAAYISSERAGIKPGDL